MKILKHFKGVYLILALMMCPMLVLSQNKKALIVAIGNYSQASDWRDINSLSDVPLIESALTKQGFYDITILKDSMATHEGIVSAFNHLIESVNANDVVVIHISSHGQRISDNNKDEIDGFDEAIVTWGAPVKPYPGYHGEKHLRDDEIEALLYDLRKKLGPQGSVLVTVDACHSGTITRSEVICRGGEPAMILQDAPVTAGHQPDEEGFSERKIHADDPSLASLVTISASLASEVNSEYKGAGSLSTAISRSADKITPDMTYREYFAQILKEMSSLAPKQQPVIEGAIDNLLYSGKGVEQQAFYTSFSINGARANLNAGKLNGLFEGSEIVVMPAGTRSVSSGKVITKGKVVVSEGTWSTVLLDEAIDNDARAFWFFVTKAEFGGIKVGLSIDVKNKKLKGVVEETLEGISLADLKSNIPDLIITEDPSGSGLVQFIHSTGDAYATGINPQESEQISEVLTSYARGKYMKDLDLRHPSIRMKFEFIPVRIDPLTGEHLDTLTLNDITRNGVVTVTEDIAVMIRVINTGKVKAFFGIIDIQPNGVINGIIPDPDPRMHQNAIDFELQPGDTFTIPNHHVAFGEPYGTEVFKLFATREPVDFTPIITNKGITRADMSAVEQLFGDIYVSPTRGGKGTMVPTDMDASTYSFTFVISEN